MTARDDYEWLTAVAEYSHCEAPPLALHLEAANALDEIDRLRHALGTAEVCAGLVQAAIHQGLHPEDFPDDAEPDPQNDRDMGRD